MIRQKRKIDHLKYSLALADQDNSGFSDINLVHRSTSAVRLADVDLSVNFLGKKIAAPLLINALTGGHPDTLEINRGLAIAARKTGLAMAVGSQKAALEDTSVTDTYKVARDENPEGVLLANLSAACTPEEAGQAVAMIDADGLQLHLNMPQELAMHEGDIVFKTILPNIKNLAGKLPLPVIAKEVGFGMSRETILDLYHAGVSIMDVGGRGGTNFISIENARKGQLDKEFEEWGIPTAICLLEGLELGLSLDLVASGGIRTPLDTAIALAAGAKLVSMARPFIEILVKGSLELLIEYIEKIKTNLARYMVMVGSANIAELAQVPLVIRGGTAEWLLRRGVDIDAYARR